MLTTTLSLKYNQSESRNGGCFSNLSDIDQMNLYWHVLFLSSGLEVVDWIFCWVSESETVFFYCQTVKPFCGSWHRVALERFSTNPYFSFSSINRYMIITTVNRLYCWFPHCDVDIDMDFWVLNFHIPMCLVIEILILTS